MECKFYYYEDKKICILIGENEKPEFELLSERKDLVKIEIEGKNTSNIYNFFRNITIKKILENNINDITINEDNIKDEDFYKEEAFKKLLELINTLIIDCNNAIKSCLSAEENSEKTENSKTVLQNDLSNSETEIIEEIEEDIN